jgi:hypothetical protein
VCRSDGQPAHVIVIDADTLRKTTWQLYKKRLYSFWSRINFNKPGNIVDFV